MKKFYKLNEKNFIVGTADMDFPQPGWLEYNFPDKFDFSEQMYYKIENNTLVNHKEEYLAALPPKELTAEEKIAQQDKEIKALQEQIKMLTNKLSL